MSQDIFNDSYIGYLAKLYNRIRNTQNAARNNLERAKCRAKRYYDQKVNPLEFEEGDSVYLLKEPTHKLGDQYTGPYKITKILNNNIMIRLSNKVTKTVHADKLKKAPTPLQPRKDLHTQSPDNAAKSVASDNSE